MRSIVFAMALVPLVSLAAMTQAEEPIHTAGGPYTVVMSSSEGGSVVDPGEGVFSYPDVQWIRLEAKAEPGYEFTAWTGTLYSISNPTVIQIDQDHEICATFSPVKRELHVDDDAPGDPSPGDPEVGDPGEDGTADHPFDSIEEAVAAARDGDTIRVHPGTYCGNISVVRKSIHLAGRDPNDRPGTPLPVIQANGKDSVVQISGTGDSPTTLSGLAIRDSQGQIAIIDCSDSVATFAHCLIVGNRPTGSGSALIQCTDSDTAFVNCTIADNHIGECDAGLRAVNSTVTLTNSIFYHNTSGCPDAADSMIYADERARVSISYSDVEGGWSGIGNIDVEPQFISHGLWVDSRFPFIFRDSANPYAVLLVGDYHLESSMGRWDGTTLNWRYDGAISPCIDGGDPAGEIGYEPAPNGRVVNMGVYGGTTEASKSY
ncbi:MAG: hypothetical protein ABFD90_02495 [Phycisphaerales bacterium]